MSSSSSSLHHSSQDIPPTPRPHHKRPIQRQGPPLRRRFLGVKVVSTHLKYLPKFSGKKKYLKPPPSISQFEVITSPLCETLHGRRFQNHWNNFSLWLHTTYPMVEILKVEGNQTLQSTCIETFTPRFLYSSRCLNQLRDRPKRLFAT